MPNYCPEIIHVTPSYLEHYWGTRICLKLLCNLLHRALQNHPPIPDMTEILLKRCKTGDRALDKREYLMIIRDNFS